ncbi:uncharacterized protein N7511_002048 [Penicillium nucicola]|uniref:uncharacterized protein n=1 Tax=Penicillium nucicola TaxID=1850975 RepID=UPI002544E531|nr:uncharacterized protein N7511_002048 [Penicillium nucicola]KAJ5769997.1 hypothetical protein N7511_002048 [Penicillium nucicola]
MMPLTALAQHFVTRGDGTAALMIPADELPTHLSIRGVPRTLQASDTQGMISCGVAPRRAEPWIIDGTVAGLPFVKTPEDLAELTATLGRIVNDETVSADLRKSVQEVLYKGLALADQAPAPTNAMVPHVLMASAPAFLPKNRTSGKVNHPIRKKVYCSYWVRHGECDYSQQGCLYKHEMPEDMEILHRIGLRTYPNWWLEHLGLPVPKNNQRGQQRIAAAPYAIGASAHDTATVAQPTVASSTVGSRGPRGNLGWKDRTAKEKNLASTESGPVRSPSVYGRPTQEGFAGSAAFPQRQAMGSPMAPAITTTQSVTRTASNNSADLVNTGSSGAFTSTAADNRAMAKGPFEHGFFGAANTVDKTHLKSKSRLAHQRHKANDSSIDGGVRLPTDLFSHFGTYSVLADMDDNEDFTADTEASSQSNIAARSTSKSPLSEILSESDPLEGDNIRDAWGPVGTPVSPHAVRATESQTGSPVPVVQSANHPAPVQAATPDSDGYQHQRNVTAIRGFPTVFSNVPRPN